ncbi:hypothetical protein HOY80DRAFT_953157, partial [Tuber brumale]
MLLERDDINPNTTDTKYARTPLSWAVEEGHEGAVQLLPERDEINPDIPDLTGKTPLESAPSSRRTSAAESLPKPKPSLPFPIDANEVPEHPSPEPFDLPQSPSKPISTTCLSVSEPLPPDARLSLGILIRSFTVISSFIFIFCLLIIISPFLPTSLSLSFH